MRAPCTFHYVRQGALFLNVMKITMPADSSGMVTPAMMWKLRRTALFIILIHGPWYLRAQIYIPSPRLVLVLWYHIMYTDIL